MLWCMGCRLEAPAGMRFCGSCGRRLEVVAPPHGWRPPALGSEAPDAKLGQLASLQGERRHLTLMFCDLVGSTALSQLLDPEDLHELINAYHLACRGPIENFDGCVESYQGDGLVAYF